MQLLVVLLGIAIVVTIARCLNNIAANGKKAACHENIAQAVDDCVGCPEQVREDFVAWNARDVGKGLATIVQLDALGMDAAFKAVIAADQGKFDVTRLPPFRPAVPTRDTTDALISRVLERFNKAADRRFYKLDLQSVKRESSFDPADRGLIDRYMINLFVQEKDPRRVHAAAYNMSMTFLFKQSAPDDQNLQVVEMYFITDHFYKNPLVGGDNIYDRDFRYKNPYHLAQPFHTTDDKVLETDDQQIAILKNHHHDVRTPQYRCFEDGLKGSDATNRDECDVNLGYWDTPVKANEECPFYQRNKNYVNRAGGIHPDGEFCQMPINTKRVGYRFISSDPIHKPWCYNCRIGADGNPGTIGPCCDEQNNKQLYPNLVSPDYAFEGDSLFRGQQWVGLAERGLHWQAYPTRIRDINDPHQRQPVFNAMISPGPGPLDPNTIPN